MFRKFAVNFAVATWGNCFSLERGSVSTRRIRMFMGQRQSYSCAPAAFGPVRG